MVLELCDGTRHVATGGAPEAGVRFHDPDFLFYLSVGAAAVPDIERRGAVRQLADADQTLFGDFHADASEQDREDAWVELDHWAVFGSFEGDRLVSAASLLRWPDSSIADLGVLTLVDARGRGHARAVVHAAARFARSKGQEPQYRCQVDNHASIALARSCGFVLFGRWTVATSASGGSS